MIRVNKNLFWKMGAGIIASLLFIILFFPSSNHVGAQTASFYPRTCLGGWKNPQEASGPSDAYLNGQYTYTENNSAVLSDSLSQLFCGDFKGDIPLDAVHRQVVLTFSWYADMPVEQSQQETEIPLIETEEPVIEPSVPEETSEPVEEPVVDAVVEESSTEEPIGEEPVEEPVVVQENVVDVPVVTPVVEESSPVENSTSEEISFLRETFFPTVHAENATMAFEVLYTVDGQEWRSLGYTGEINNTVHFELPIELFGMVSDVEKVQIALHPIPSFDSAPTVYVDAMWLDIHYTLSETEENLLLEQPLEEITEEELALVEEEFVEENQPDPNSVPIELPVLSFRNFDKNIVIDTQATHRCVAENFHVDITNQAVSQVQLAVTPAGRGVSELEIGSLPSGIDITFQANGLYTYQLENTDSVVAMQIVNQYGSQKGNFTIPIMYTKKGDVDSSVVCQLNIVN
ncbi:MAG: hypothetical protein KBD15_01545 [Candidatus Magasanikbacteria bacterium]|nr:hypothetical protein [Candidatus Magasanikbacteria bacterium]